MVRCLPAIRNKHKRRNVWPRLTRLCEEERHSSLRGGTTKQSLLLVEALYWKDCFVPRNDEIDLPVFARRNDIRLCEEERHSSLRGGTTKQSLLLVEAHYWKDCFAKLAMTMLTYCRKDCLPAEGRLRPVKNRGSQWRNRLTRLCEEEWHSSLRGGTTKQSLLLVEAHYWKDCFVPRNDDVNLLQERLPACGRQASPCEKQRLAKTK
jgi:hypothetical protein